MVLVVVMMIKILKVDGDTRMYDAVWSMLQLVQMSIAYFRILG
jgi:hypothetical protein